MLKFEELAVQPGFVPRSAGTEGPAPAAFRRVTVEDKKVINSKADVNQLVPFKYKWAWEKYLAACAYHYIVESLDLDQGEVFNAYHEIASIREKDEFLVPFIDTLTDPAFVTGTPQNDQALLRSLIVFSCLMEGMFFY